jgi:hypothetical protein
MPDETDRQAILDNEHLKLLSWGYLVMGGFTFLISLMSVIYVAMGAGILMMAKVPGQATKPGGPPPEIVGWFLMTFGVAFFVAMAVGGSLKLYAAHCIRKRKSRLFCQVIAALLCLELPYGTFLGVCTFLVLGRESVSRMFTPRAG